MCSTPCPLPDALSFRIPPSHFRIPISVMGNVGMGKTQSNLAIQRFVSTTGKNQYLLTSAGEAAVIDVSDSYDEICKILDNMVGNTRLI